MGKYMKKGKITGDIAVMEIPQSSSSLGVRTRARTLALQPNSDLSCLQLRNRRLEKPLPPPQKQPPPTKCGGGNSRVRVGSVKSVSDGGSEKGEGRFGTSEKVVVVGRCETEEFNDLGDENFCGENYLDFDSRDRSTRESTPCNLIRDAETIGTPSSTTRSTCSASTKQQRYQARDAQRHIPTTPEMEEFFAGFELQQQKQFMEKYNYDVMNDLPLPGRYEWVRVDN